MVTKKGYKTIQELDSLLTEAFLLREYVEKKKSRWALSKEIGCDESTIKDRLIKYCIPVRGIKEAYSKETRQKVSKARRGKNNPNWKGGASSFYSLIYNISEAVTWRRKIFERDKYTCQKCNIKGGKLEAHHIKKFVLIIREFLAPYSYFNIEVDREKLLELAKNYIPFWDLNNGRTLCYDCHCLVEKETRLVA